MSPKKKSTNDNNTLLVRWLLNEDKTQTIFFFWFWKLKGEPKTKKTKNNQNKAKKRKETTRRNINVFVFWVHEGRVHNIGRRIILMLKKTQNSWLNEKPTVKTVNETSIDSTLLWYIFSKKKKNKKHSCLRYFFFCVIYSLNSVINFFKNKKYLQI